MPEKLVISALQRASWTQPPTPGRLVLADRGGQYCGNTYRNLLHGHEDLRSPSRRGDCNDKAQAEDRLKVLDAAGPASKPRGSNVGQWAVFAKIADAKTSAASYFD